MDKMFNLLLISLWETIYMVGLSVIFSLILGAPIGVLAVITSKNNIMEMPKLNRVLDVIINILRSIPFIILMIVLFPLARLIVGTTIGSTAAIVPLAIGASPFVARVVEGALKEVDTGLIEASKSMGASTNEIIFKVLIPEAFPSLIHGLTIMTISLVGYSAMAGAIGAGGLGNLAITQGYQRFQTDVLFASVITIILLVQLIQLSGDSLVKLIKNKTE